jgi:hypothetical protein
MSKNALEASVLTANRLSDGVVVFLDCEGGWAERIGAALIARTTEEARALGARGARDAAHNLVVDPYLVEVREEPDGPTPLRMRERVRVAGPSILADVPGYAPSPRASEGVRPLAPDPSASRNRRGEGSDPFPVPSGQREPAASVTQAA